MPYQHRSPRQLRRHVVTFQDVCRANRQVTAELDKLGFWSDRLDHITVHWTAASVCNYGWYQGHIHIPAVTGAQLADLIFGQYTRLTDILRHEWAHAVADQWPELIDTRRFVRDFGGPYESGDQVREYDPDHHLTFYAATMPGETFPEVFHFHLRHKGRLPMRLAGKPGIARKWLFVAWMAEKISRAVWMCGR